MAQTPQEFLDSAPSFRGMVEKHVFSALRLKRNEISGHIHDLEKRVARQRANLANLDSTIKLFSPGTNPGAIPAKRPYRRTRYFAHNELSRLTQDALRTASKPLTTARQPMCHEAKGSSTPMRRLRKSSGSGAYRVAASRKAQHRGEVRDKPERSMGTRHWQCGYRQLTFPLDDIDVFSRQKPILYSLSDSLFNPCLSGCLT